MLKNKLIVAVSLSVLGCMIFSSLQAMKREDEYSVLITIVPKQKGLDLLRQRRRINFKLATELEKAEDLNKALNKSIRYAERAVLHKNSTQEDHDILILLEKSKEDYQKRGTFLSLTRLLLDKGSKIPGC